MRIWNSDGPRMERESILYTYSSRRRSYRDSRRRRLRLCRVSVFATHSNDSFWKTSDARFHKAEEFDKASSNLIFVSPLAPRAPPGLLFSKTIKRIAHRKIPSESVTAKIHDASRGERRNPSGRSPFFASAWCRYPPFERRMGHRGGGASLWTYDHLSYEHSHAQHRR